MVPEVPPHNWHLPLPPKVLLPPHLLMPEAKPFYLIKFKESLWGLIAVNDSECLLRKSKCLPPHPAGPTTCLQSGPEGPVGAVHGPV